MVTSRPNNRKDRASPDIHQRTPTRDVSSTSQKPLSKVDQHRVDISEIKTDIKNRSQQREKYVKEQEKANTFHDMINQIYVDLKQQKDKVRSS